MEKFKNRIKVIFLKLLGMPSHVLLVAGRIVLHSGRNVDSRNTTLAIYPFGGTSRDLMSLLDVPLLGISLVPTKEEPLLGILMPYTCEMAAVSLQMQGVFLPFRYTALIKTLFVPFKG